VVPPQASETLYTTLQRYQLLLVFGARRLWQAMTPDFDRSWASIAPSLAMLTSGAQLASAQLGAAYVPAVLAETGQPDRPEARVRPQAFAGVASDGRSLPGLLEGAVVTSKRAVERGASPDAALLGGQKWLEVALRTAVADAARDATQAELLVRRAGGYVRMVNPPCCSRCAVLAGKWYRSNDILPRHPACDCQLIPAAENVAGDFLTDPTELARRGLINDLTRNQQERLDQGADLGKVLNESRDRWRERMAADRRATKSASKRTQWAGAEPGEAATIHDFMANLTSRVDVLKEMRAAGIAQ
jgi:hypothetical protein